MRERKHETCKREREKDKMELCGSRGSVVAGFGQKKKKNLEATCISYCMDTVYTFQTFVSY